MDINQFVQALQRVANTLHDDASTAFERGLANGYQRALDDMSAYSAREVQWQDAPLDDGYYWLEALPPDMPPQFVRGRDVSTFGGTRVQWEYNTPGGFVPLTGRVCPIGTRPESLT